MLMIGSEYLQSIRDGRRVYIGSERVDDVTTHPAFRNAAQTLATIYDRKRAPENREVMTCEGYGETFSGPTTAVPERQNQEFAALAGDPGPGPRAGAPGDDGWLDRADRSVGRDQSFVDAPDRSFLFRLQQAQRLNAGAGLQCQSK